MIYPTFMVAVGIYMLIMIAAAASGSMEPDTWLRTIAEWGASSSGHVPWSATILVTSAGALAALSNSSLAKDEALGLVLVLAAQTIAVGAALWTLTAIVAVTFPGVIDDTTERSQLWGVVFVAGPIICGASLFAGRFRRIGPGRRIENARRSISSLDEELCDMRSRVYVAWGLARARCSAWIPPLATWAVCSAVLVGELIVEGMSPPRDIAGMASIFSLTWGWCALTAGFIQIFASQPTGRLWRWGAGIKRRPTALGIWVISAVIIANIIGVALLGFTVLAIILDANTPRTDAPFRLLSIFLCGVGAVLVSVLKGRRGRNAWATTGYALRARRRRALLAQIHEAQREIDSRKRTTRFSRSLARFVRSK